MEELTWTERREASFLNVLEASWPQAPNDSTPSSSQIPEFACIFRCSVAKAAAPAVCPASETMSGFSGDDTDRSNAAGLPLKPRLLTRMSAGSRLFLVMSKTTASFQLRVV